MTRVVLAVDGNSLLHRSFHAQARTGLCGLDGRPMWAVRGLLSQLVAAIDRIGPDAVVVGFDDAHRNVRREKWPHYKSGRVDKLDTLVGQLARAVDVLRGLGVAVVVPTGLEADDVLASVAAYAPTVGAQTVIVTSDRDSFALIDKHTRVLRILNGGVENSPLLSADRLALMIGIGPHQYRDYAALRGDPSDNLPGVHGIGPKTAMRLLLAFETAGAAFDDIEAGGGRVRAELGAGIAERLAHPHARSTWQHNCEVMHMHSDVDLGFHPSTGPGRLPLAAAAVRRTFLDHQLTATMAGALRVLCGIEPADGASLEPRTRTVWPPRWSPASSLADAEAKTANSGAPRFARAVRPVRAPTPSVAQLSLF